MSAPPSPDRLHDLSCHSRRTSHQSSADSTASIQSLHIASVPLSSFSTSCVPVSTLSPRSTTVARYHSPEASPGTSYHVYQHDQNAVDGSQGSALGTGEVVGLMRTIDLTSSPTTSIIPERDLEEGEIRESLASPKSTVGRVPRQREQSFGGALPSSPEVLPSAASDRPAARLAPTASNGAISSVEINNLSNLPTSSTLSSILSSSSFHTASSSSSIPTSISNSGSVNNFSMYNSGSQVSSGETQFVPRSKPISSPLKLPLSSRPAQVPEVGPIDLEALEMDNTNATLTLNLNSDVTPAHILSSGDDSATDGSYDATDDQYKSPNVYINGLPPHYPEDQLFELTSPFGEIRSVRSFTRHVGEKESGYGFVLFETVEAAEKCIQSLRRFRNLHPTFSKQSHKIPGMPYTQSSLQNGWTHEHDNGPSLAHGASSFVAGGGAGKNQTSELSFKVKMERLQDPNSTNLYIEGLPMSIDEPSLVALVSPHRIKSSRFFQTRLSNPPRIIAFVRLETRQGAEEVVERLHGRMVRGWNDPGSRISVRFADTSEQRELRRTERVIREDDAVSPARLTIAQAALLNLRGRDQLRNQQYQQTGITAPPIGASRLGHGSAPTANQVYNDFSSNAHDLSSAAAGGYRGSASDLTSAAQLLSGLNNGPRRGANLSPYHQASPLPNVTGKINQDLTPAMAALLDSLRGSGTPWTGHDDCYTGPQHQLPTLRNAHPALGAPDLNLVFGSQYQNHVGGGVAQTRSGYTPAEELILNAHVQRRKGGSTQTHYHHHTQHGDDADFNVGVRGYRTQASTMAVQQQYYPPSGNLPVVVESDGDHEVEHQRQLVRYPQSQLNGRARAGAQLRNSGLRERDVYNNNAISNDHNQQAHVRSTTLPPSSTPSTAVPRHYQHNSMSIPKPRNITNDILRTTSSQLQTITSNQPQAPLSLSKHRSTNSISSSIINDNKSHDSNNHNNNLYSDASDIRIQDGGSSYTDLASTNQSQHHYRANYPTKKGGDQDPSFGNNGLNSKNADNFDNGSYGGTAHPFPRDSEGYDVSQTSPPLVSPALTYSSRGSGATLSPSTPYVGSFSSASCHEAGGEFQSTQRVETEIGVGER
ncbi:hypothetical protein J3R30DRAFT_3369576 [Lentinula aciculospora]|uniref:RRM domain-containing protein n=1 Tax=Lentinula aciculospora TaxID=153920 RepID=A0A9W9AII3_9AGAR|nr:hypothetical protein J3R30DRAFT_3369576 [Lentinula aciculospora]